MGRAQRLPCNANQAVTKPPPHGISSTYSTWGKHGVMWFGCLACWLLGGFVGLAALLLGWLVAWLVGWLVGWHSVDGCMDGRMDGSCAASRSGGVRVSFRFPSIGSGCSGFCFSHP